MSLKRNIIHGNANLHFTARKLSQRNFSEGRIFRLNFQRSRPAPGFDRVRMPGEMEAQKTLEARSQGLDIPDGVWAGLAASADRFDIDLDAFISSPSE